MGMERGMISAAVMLLGVLTLQGKGQPQTDNITFEAEGETKTDAAGEVINIYEETGIEPDRERKAERELIEGTYRLREISDWFSYSVFWSHEPRNYGELTGSQVSIGRPLGEDSYFVVWDDDGGYTNYFIPEGGMDMPNEIPDSFWSAADGDDPAQGSPMTLRDLNTYLLDRLFIELNNEDIGEYRINDYSVTNRYWTDSVIGTEIVFHVTPKAERAEELEYFQGILARAGLTDTEKIKEIMGDLELPGADEWAAVPHPEDTVVEGMIPYTSQPSPRMEAVIAELKGMLTEKGYTPEEADRIANILMFRYYPLCAEWLTEEQEYSFCFRTELNEEGNPVSILVDRIGGGQWNSYIPQMKTKEEQQEAYFQAGYHEMDGMMNVMF